MAIAGSPASQPGSSGSARRYLGPHAAAAVVLVVGLTVTVVLASAAFESAMVTTAARGTLIAYTDGLAERRGETLDAGLQRLQDAAAQAVSSLEDLLSNIVTELTGNSPTDDIALIGLRWLN